MRRVVSVVGVAALCAGAAGCWAVPGQGPLRQSYNPLETAISVENVATLEPAWTALVGQDTPTNPPVIQPGTAGSPVVSSVGMVHVATPASIHGINARTGADVWHVSEPWGGGTFWDDQVFATSDGRIVAGNRTGNEPQTNGWFDAATGEYTDGPSTHEPNSLRDPWVAGLSGFTDFSQGPGPVSVQFLHVTNIDDPEAGWTGRIGNGVGWNGATLGATQVFQAGGGLVSGVPGDGTVHNGFRAYAIEGAATNCGPAEYPDHACPQWYVPLDGVAATAPVLSTDEATAYVSTDAGTVYAVDTTTGTIRWSAAVGAGYQDPPALAEGTLLVPTPSGSLVALDADGCGAATCTPLWTTAPGSELTVQPGVAGGVVFTGAADGTVAAYALAGCGAATCDPLWTDPTGSRITGAPAISLGKVFVGTEDGRVIAYAPSGA